MRAYFLDSSALVKRYIAEVGSAWVAGLLDPASSNRIYVATIAGADVVAALARRRVLQAPLAATLSRGINEFQSDFNRRFYVIELSSPLILEAMELAERRAIRGYDCVQLAAAMAEGLTVENPNNHP